MEQLQFKILVDLFAEEVHVHLYHVGSRIKIDIPDLLRDGELGNNFSFMQGEQLQQLEFLGGKRDLFSGAGHFFPLPVDFQVRDHELVALCGRYVRPGALQEYADAGQQLPEVEGFYQVIVCPQLKSLHLVVHAAEGGEHDNGHFAVAAADHFARSRSRCGAGG